jgi:glycosyltransferase involved in cell wall biosynthesis
MHVLLITREEGILRDGSPAQEALKEKAKAAGRTYVIVMNSQSRPGQARRIGESIWIFPTNSFLPFMKIFDALYLVRHEIFYRNNLQADLISADDPVVAGFAAVLVKRKYNKPLHIHVDRNIFASFYVWHSLFNAFRSTFARIMLERANAISVSREPIREGIVERDPLLSEKITVIPRYQDPQAIINERMGEDLHVKYTQFRAILLVVAPLVAEHNIHIAIDTVAEIAKIRQNIGVVIVGDGYRRWFLKRYARARGVEDKVIFEGSRSDLTSYYKTAFALLVTSQYEEYETTIEDAAAAGCPVISSSVGMAPKIIKDHVNGFLCDPKNPAEYWHAVSNMIDDPRGYAYMRDQMRQTMQQFIATDAPAQSILLKKCWDEAVFKARGF